MPPAARAIAFPYDTAPASLTARKPKDSSMSCGVQLLKAGRVHSRGLSPSDEQGLGFLFQGFLNQLPPIQLRIKAVARQELLMGATLDNFAVF